MMTSPSPGGNGFSRVELAVVLGTVAFLATIALPALANNRFRSEQVSCLSNLRQIGHAFHLWANDHGDKNHWWTPISEGGTYLAPGETAPWPFGPSLRNNSYFQFAWISNELATPQILVCPGDQGVGTARNPAANFSGAPDGGFLHPAYENQAVSYLIGLHSFYASPRSVLSGDRNIRWSAQGLPCVAGPTSTFGAWGTSEPIRWTNAIHGLTGNLLFTDGSVEQSSFLGLYLAINLPAEKADLGYDHYIAPP